MPEKKYIELQAAIREFQTNGSDFVYGRRTCNAIISRLKRVPAANVRPNIPGNWIRENNPSYSPFDDSSEYRYRCSQCDEYNNRESAFCPDCGAQMRGGEQNGV